MRIPCTKWHLTTTEVDVGCDINLSQIPFDVFDIEHIDEWKRVKEQFYSEVALIDDEAKTFIDASFKTLRSAIGAFEMLLNFSNIRSRDSINSQMMRKFNDILAQFDKEVKIQICPLP